MHVPDDKEIANHVVPESGVTHHVVWREALTGVRAGHPLSRERHLFRTPMRLCTCKATRLGASNANAQAVRHGVIDPGMCARSLNGNREISSVTAGASTGRRPASGRRGAEANDARAGEV